MHVNFIIPPKSVEYGAPFIVICYFYTLPGIKQAQ